MIGSGNESVVCWKNMVFECSSVYLVWLTPEEVPELRRAIGPLLAANDQFDVFPVDERGARRRFSWQRGQENCAPVIVVDEWCEKQRIS